VFSLLRLLSSLPLLLSLRNSNCKIDFPLFPLQLVAIASVSYVVSCDTPMCVTFITLFVTLFVTLRTSCVGMVIKYCRHISASSHFVPLVPLPDI
jgi:hypothetical protein